MAERREKNRETEDQVPEWSIYILHNRPRTRGLHPSQWGCISGPRLRRKAVISIQFFKQKIRTSTEYTGGWRVIFRNKTSLSMPIICLKEVSSKPQMIWWKLPIYTSLVTVNGHWNSHLSGLPIDLFSWKWKKKMFLQERGKNTWSQSFKAIFPSGHKFLKCTFS